MKSMAEVYLEKFAAEVPKSDIIYTLKRHEERERPGDEAKEDAREKKTEHDLGIEKEAKVQPKPTTASDVTNNQRAVLLVTIAGTDQPSKIFVEKLDRVLQSMSGLDRLDIKAVNSMKDSGTVNQLKAPRIGIDLFRGGKSLGSLGQDASEAQIRKFIEKHRKNII